jgi:hypothetical protein
MKQLFIAIALTFMLFSKSTAQTTETGEKLDQIALMKQFEGTWEATIGVDSLSKFTLTLPGKGGECEFVYSTKGKVYAKGKQLWGIDPKEDMIIAVQMTNYRSVGIWKMKFITPKEVKASLYSIDNPKDPKVEWKMEFVSEEELKQTLINSKKTKILNYKRIK